MVATGVDVGVGEGGTAVGLGDGDAEAGGGDGGGDGVPPRVLGSGIGVGVTDGVSEAGGSNMRSNPPPISSARPKSISQVEMRRKLTTICTQQQTYLDPDQQSQNKERAATLQIRRDSHPRHLFKRLNSNQRVDGGP